MNNRFTFPLRKQYGTATIEFVLALPVLMAMLFIILDYGRIFYFDMALTHAARVAAEHGSINSAVAGQEALIRTIAKEEAEKDGIDVLDENIDVLLECSCISGSTETPLESCSSGCYSGEFKNYFITVSMMAVFNTILKGFIGNNIEFKPVNLQATTSMRTSNYY